MKLNRFNNLSRPRIATFENPGDCHSGTIVEDPNWIPDPLDTSRECLKVLVQDDFGVYWQFHARTQMPDAIHDAVVAAGQDELAVGGRLTVRWVESRGNKKIYHALYAAPDNEKAPF